MRLMVKKKRDIHEASRQHIECQRKNNEIYKELYFWVTQTFTVWQLSKLWTTYIRQAEISMQIK